jgi:hypothetical protein
VLYIGNWRVRLDLVPEVQYRPEAAIENLSSSDRDILRNMRNMKDFKKFQQKRKQLQINLKKKK